MTLAPSETTFAETFRSALSDRGVTLSWLRARIQERGHEIALSTLSYWRSQGRTPDAEAQREVIAAVEQELRLDSGRLMALAASRSPVATTGRFTESLPSTDPDIGLLFTEAQERLQSVSNDRFRVVSMQQTTTVGLDGCPQYGQLQTVMQCTGAPFSRIAYCSASPMGQASVLTHHVFGDGHIAEEWIDPTHRMKAVAVEFDRPLLTGDTAMFIVTHNYAPGTPSDQGMGVGVAQPSKKLVNWVRFHPDRIPDWLIEVENSIDSEGVPAPEARRFRALDTRTSVHQVRWSFGPGSIALQWGYGPALDL
ncbi:MAG TPA: hypothetical protein VN108_02165 [Marmoricola sp.]|nr:hypothetical protein [Marmoricola sp.]